MVLNHAKKSKHYELRTKWDFREVFRWSEAELLTDPVMTNEAAQVVPQGTNLPKYHSDSITYKLKLFYSNLYYKLIKRRKLRRARRKAAAP